jgi:hypothetical protein
MFFTAMIIVKHAYECEDSGEGPELVRPRFVARSRMLSRLPNEPLPLIGPPPMPAPAAMPDAPIGGLG